jgi:hypothetical protein
MVSKFVKICRFLCIWLIITASVLTVWRRLQDETYLSRFSFYLCPINFWLNELFFGFWWADPFWFEIESWCLVASLWVGLMSSLVVCKLRSVILRMWLKVDLNYVVSVLLFLLVFHLYTSHLFCNFSFSSLCPFCT